jgi:hypothetical protein
LQPLFIMGHDCSVRTDLAHPLGLQRSGRPLAGVILSREEGEAGENSTGLGCAWSAPGIVPIV